MSAGEVLPVRVWELELSEREDGTTGAITRENV